MCVSVSIDDIHPLFYFFIVSVGREEEKGAAALFKVFFHRIHSNIIYFGFLTGKKCEVKPRNFNLGDKSDTSFPPPAKTAIKQGWKLHHFLKLSACLDVVFSHKRKGEKGMQGEEIPLSFCQSQRTIPQVN